MIVKIGDIFSSRATTLVNTVNCVGVMGKGIAEEFKKRYPEMFKEYVSLCEAGQVRPGVPYYYHDLIGNSIINFPTKDHWKSPSKLSYIVSGLQWFCDNYVQLGITSVAFPPLGCGNGGLSWAMVGPVMYSFLKDLPIEIEIYAPYGTSKEQLTKAFLGKEAPVQEAVKGVQIGLNRYWYPILYVVKELNNDKYALSVGRVIFQKICYVLTREGLPTGFHFVKGSYGPYAGEVKTAITALSNANLMSEVRLGQMIETRVNPQFELRKNQYTHKELEIVDRTVDLLCRVKDTDQAEVMMTVMFSFDELVKNNVVPTEEDILIFVMDWKKRWISSKEKAVISTIRNLSELGWISPLQSRGLISVDEDLF